MKVPPKRKGNAAGNRLKGGWEYALNESPSEKEGKSSTMTFLPIFAAPLNESPSEKEGKLGHLKCSTRRNSPQ